MKNEVAQQSVCTAVSGLSLQQIDSKEVHTRKGGLSSLYLPFRIVPDRECGRVRVGTGWGVGDGGRLRRKVNVLKGPDLQIHPCFKYRVSILHNSFDAPAQFILVSCVIILYCINNFRILSLNSEVRVFRRSVILQVHPLDIAQF